MSNFKRLCEITADMIDEKKVTNLSLKSVFERLSRENKGFIYHHMHKQYNVNGHTEYGDDEPNHDYCEYSETYDEYSEEHKDHKDHTEHSEKAHNDNHYSEGAHHTDSDGGHVDRVESKHIDVSK